MTTLFGRRWRVQVGTLVTSDVDITFKIKRTLASRPGTLELSLYNLSADHRAEIEGSRRAGVQLDAGYVGAVSMLFAGDVRRASTKRDGTDLVTTVTAGDGEHAVRNARVVGSFARGTPLDAMAQAIAAGMGVGVGNATTMLQNIAGGRTARGGTLVDGTAAQELTRLCAAAGLEWSIQDGALQLLTLGGALQRTAIRLADGTGLIGSPEKGKAGKVKASALIIPDLVPGRLVVVDSSTVIGGYRIESSETTGDTRGDDWTVAMELKVV